MIELKPIKIVPPEYDQIERIIKAAFRKILYEPLLKELALPKKTIMNAKDSLFEALKSGRITFWRGRFQGQFNADISRELKRYGAKWDMLTSSFHLLLSELPMDLRSAISASEVYFQKRIQSIDKKLAQVLPETIADSIRVANLFDSTLWKTDRQLNDSLKGIAIAPKLTDGQRKKIADEWQNNMDLWIKNFSKDEIIQLRKDIQASAFSGNRRESMIKSIQKSYGVTENKAKFLARQETSLLMTKFKESRYTDSGISEYKWRCVAGSKNHPVRPAHKILDGTTHRWDNPPVTNPKTGARNNPGQDYNCRCFAIPIVRFK